MAKKYIFFSMKGFKPGLPWKKSKIEKIQKNNSIVAFLGNKNIAL